MKSRICTVVIDSNLDETLKKFQKQLSANEEIVSVEQVDKKLVILVKESNSRNNKKLLLE
jgi:hypothetical protein